MIEPDPFRENADLLRALEERLLTGAVQVPQQVLSDLEDVRRKALQARRPVIQAPFVVRHSRFLRIAAVFILLASLTWLFIPATGPTARVVVTSPGDEITDTQPRITWNSKDKPGQKYDVWILPAEGDHLTTDALFVAKSVTSPVSFTQLQPSLHTALQPGTDYRVLICLAGVGRTAGVPVSFKVNPVP